MIPPEIPAGEPERLSALKAYGVLDTPPEKEFDDITWLAAEIAKVPIALVSLIDSHRQWFKSRIGLNAIETPREISICGHTIHHKQPLLVEDTSCDERFAGNPFVKGEPGIRFYGGFPLTTPSGYTIGTLCVIDLIPRTLTQEQQRMLAVLANQVMTQLELRTRSKALEKTLDKAQAANEAKSLFLANMSHEIRTPLNAIMGLTELLVKSPVDARQREDLITIQDASESLMHLINEVLDYAKIEAGKLSLESITFNIQEGFHKSLKPMRAKALQKNLAFSLHLDPKIPQYLVGDPHRLGQILVNLVGNAVKFTDAGEITITVFPVTDQDRPGIRCTIRDTGIGIAKNRQHLVFDAFSQGDGSTTRRFGGTGLGLTITKRLVELFDGEIRLESEVGRGSTFTFTAYFQAASDTYQSAKPSQARAALPSELKGSHILVVEDNQVNRRLAARFLEKMGLRVTLAANGMEALAKIRDQWFDLVLMDIQMPEMDGFTATTKIREIERAGAESLPIVAMTAHAMKGDRERCLAVGMTDYLSKPINWGHLGDVIQRVLTAGERKPPQEGIGP